LPFAVSSPLGFEPRLLDRFPIRDVSFDDCGELVTRDTRDKHCIEYGGGEAHGSGSIDASSSTFSSNCALR
jgi:hypothetical protein